MCVRPLKKLTDPYPWYILVHDDVIQNKTKDICISKFIVLADGLFKGENFSLNNNTYVDVSYWLVLTWKARSDFSYLYFYSIILFRSTWSSHVIVLRTIFHITILSWHNFSLQHGTWVFDIIEDFCIGKLEDWCGIGEDVKAPKCEPMCSSAIPWRW